MGTIRIEADGDSEMSRVYRWLANHRGQVVPLDADKTLTLGVPISGARAVILAATLNNGVAGVLRALANLTGPPIRFVFDIRSRSGLDAGEVRAIGAEALLAISRRIAEDDVVTQVA
jgi:hypothetical protein